MNPNILVFEPVSRTVSLALSLKKVLLDVKTKYQHVQIVEIEEFGRALILDGLIQCTEADEYLYHESLVHPVMITHPKPKKVLIVGGGDGAALREAGYPHSGCSSATATRTEQHEHHQVD
jgi:spermidine synthase